jgi:hypothetical protein
MPKSLAILFFLIWLPGCVTYPCSKRYVLVWSDPYTPHRSLSGLSLNECYDVGRALPKGVSYRCLEETTRRNTQIQTHTRVHINLRGQF